MAGRFTPVFLTEFQADGLIVAGKSGPSNQAKPSRPGLTGQASGPANRKGLRCSKPRGATTSSSSGIGTGTCAGPGGRRGHLPAGNKLQFLIGELASVIGHPGGPLPGLNLLGRQLEAAQERFPHENGGVGLVADLAVDDGQQFGVTFPDVEKLLDLTFRHSFFLHGVDETAVQRSRPAIDTAAGWQGNSLGCSLLDLGAHQLSRLA